MASTILVVAANPADTPPLRLDQEVREINNGLERAQKRDEFVVKQKWATRPVDIRRAMLDFKPRIVHFCGHGMGEEGIAFEDENGLAKLVSVQAIAGFFELFADKVECVVLNACYSEVQAEAIARHIPYVIGMKRAIGDSAAIEFATAFYDAIGAGESFEFAYRLACNAIEWENIPEHLTPVLRTKAESQNTPGVITPVGLDDGVTGGVETRTVKPVEAGRDASRSLEPDPAPALRTQAEADQKKGRYAEAILAATRALELEPDNAFALRTRAEAYRGNGQLDEAVQDATRALELEPKNAFALRTRADAYQQQGRNAEAIQDATQALELEPDNAFALRTRAEALRSGGQNSAALQDVHRALELESDNAFALRTRAEVYRSSGQFADAIRDASQALQFEPDNAFALRTRAEAYRSSGQFAEAIRDASRALELEPQNAFALRTLAEAFRQQTGKS
jgi:tetratricopeptide (TPR) repeat protein